MKTRVLLFIVFALFSTNYVHAQCSPHFSYNDGNCPSIAFTDSSSTSTGVIVAWTYDFGDGNISALQNPTHTYSANGTYVVCLTITTSTFCTNTFCDTVVVDCIQPPSCDASYNYTLGNCPSIAFFDNSTSQPGSIALWFWDFGDGSTSALQNPTHTYAANGSYITCLTITSQDDCQSTFCDTINISCIQQPSCDARFNYNLGNCPSVAYTDNSTSQPGSIALWLWDFGDGNSSTSQNPTHTYAANGTYLTCLTITSQDDCQSTFCDTITIDCIQPPSCFADFSINTDNCPEIAFSDSSTTSSGIVVSWAWDFGDGNTSILKNPSHTYAANGTYTVCLVIETSSDCEDTLCREVTIGCIDTNIPTQETESSFSIYPIPATDVLSIVPDSKQAFNAFYIYDLSGKLMFSNNVTASEIIQIDIQSLQKGMYLIELTGNNENVISRFIKE